MPKIVAENFSLRVCTSVPEPSKQNHPRELCDLIRTSSVECLAKESRAGRFTGSIERTSLLIDKTLPSLAAVLLLRRRRLMMLLRRRARMRRALMRRGGRLMRRALRTALVALVRPVLISAVGVVIGRRKRSQAFVTASVRVIVAPLIPRWRAAFVRGRERTEALVVSAICIVVRGTVGRW